MVQSVLGGCKLDPKFAVHSNTPQGQIQNSVKEARPPARGKGNFSLHNAEK